MIEERIESYLNGDMTEEEQAVFEVEIKNDPVLEQSVLLQKAIMRGFTGRKVEDFRGRLADINKEQQPERRNISIYWKSAMMIAASLLLIFVGRVIFSTSLFDRYFEPYPNYVMPVQRGSAEHSTLGTALQLYENEEYREAYRHFQNLDRSDTVHFYLAQCKLILGIENPEEDLLAVLASSSNTFQNQASWYLALYYLQHDRNKEARKLLEEIIKMGGSYSGKAMEIIGELP